MALPSREAPVINSAVLDQLRSGNIQKVAADVAAVLKVRVRETGRARKILAPKQVMDVKSECNITERAGDTPLVQYRMEVDPDALGGGSTAFGRPDSRYFRARFVFVTLNRLSSERIKINDADIRVSSISVMETLEERLAKVIQESEDEQFSRIIRQGVVVVTYQRALKKHGITINTVAKLALYLFTRTVTYNGGAWPGGGILAADVSRATSAYSNILMLEDSSLTKESLVDLKKVCSVNENTPSMFFMHKSTYEDIEKWTANDAGYDNTDTTVLEGWQHNKVLGIDVMWSIRDNDIVIRPGEIFVFPPSAFMGLFVEVAEPVVFVQRTSSTETEFEMSEYIGMGVMNFYQVGLALLEGYTTYLLVPAIVTGGAEGYWELTNNYAQTSLSSVTSYPPSKGMEQ